MVMDSKEYKDLYAEWVRVGKIKDAALLLPRTPETIAVIKTLIAERRALYKARMLLRPKPQLEVRPCKD